MNLKALYLSHMAVLPRDEWEVDAACEICLSCNVVFTFCLRRHHCRVCGQIFCARCADKKVLSHRACNKCYKTVRECAVTMNSWDEKSFPSDQLLDIGIKLAHRRRAARNPWRAYLNEDTLESVQAAEGDGCKLLHRLDPVLHLLPKSAQQELSQLLEERTAALQLATQAQAESNGVQKPNPAPNTPRDKFSRLKTSSSDSSLSRLFQASQSQAQPLKSPGTPNNNNSNPDKHGGLKAEERKSSSHNLSKLFSIPQVNEPQIKGVITTKTTAALSPSKKRPRKVPRLQVAPGAALAMRGQKWIPVLTAIYEEGVFEK